MAEEIWIDEPTTSLDLTVNLSPLPIDLAEVIVEGDRTILAFGKLADFYRRRQSGIGKFLTDREIQKRHAFYATDLLTAAGIWVTTDSLGHRVLGSGRRGGNSG